MRGGDLGRIQAGYYADCVLVDGDPLQDITVLQDHSRLSIILINGRVHKAARGEYLADASGVTAAAAVATSHLAQQHEFPEVKVAMQKSY